jgi:alpha-glucosidase
MSGWWKEAIVYQIYPRSFQDSDGDGVGDLAGIRRRLPYLRELGIDALWLSPINRSPMHDFGYDISDYRDIDPLFGTLSEFDDLLAEAKSMGIRVLMDLVVNHTSHLHPWFVEARSSRFNPKRDWYIWHDGVKGNPPNNWKSVFGGSAWKWDEATESYYYHGFLAEQPDLNWRNPEVKQAVFEDLEFWLKRGVSGFRLDVVNHYFKDDQFRNNPLRLWGWQYPRPYELQSHIFDKNRPEMHGLLRDLRALLDRYDAMSVGEVFLDYPGSPEGAASFLGQNDELHLAFDFAFFFQSWSASGFGNVIRQWDKACGSNWPALALNNHDQPRTYSKYAHGSETDARARVLAALLLTARGTPFLYYGEEIGMKDGRIRRSEIRDPVGIRYWPLNPGRDPQRTPMLWSADANGGFTSGKPWLPVNDDAAARSVETQIKDPGSILSWHRRLIQLRRSTPALRLGSFEPWNAGNPDTFAYMRDHEGERRIVLLNFSNRPREVRLPGRHEIVLSSHRLAGESLDSSAMLAPYESVVLR